MILIFVYVMKIITSKKFYPSFIICYEVNKIILKITCLHINVRLATYSSRICRQIHSYLRARNLLSVCLQNLLTDSDSRLATENAQILLTDSDSRLIAEMQQTFQFRTFLSGKGMLIISRTYIETITGGKKIVHLFINFYIFILTLQLAHMSYERSYINLNFTYLTLWQDSRTARLLAIHRIH